MHRLARAPERGSLGRFEMRKSALAAMGVALQIAGVGCGDDAGVPTVQPSPTPMPTLTTSPTFTPTIGPNLTITVAATARSGLIHILARVQHHGDAPVWSVVGGCTGSGMLDDSGIDLMLADSATRLLSQDEEYPCGPPRLCSVAILELAPGQSVTREFDLDGTVWVLDQPENPRSGCDDLVPSQNPYPRCTPSQLPPGRYTVVARFPYCVSEADQTDGIVEGGATFEWP